MHLRLIWPLLAVVASGQTITNFAGNGTPGFSGNFGPATDAQINNVVGLASDPDGNIYLADEKNNAVRKVQTNGNIVTFAGQAAAGFGGDGGQATQAQLNGPLGVCVSPTGTIYVNDQGNHRVRAVSITGTIITVAGNGTVLSTGDGGPALGAGMVIPIRCAVDQSGNLFIVDQGAHIVRKMDTNGILTTVAGVNNTHGFSGDGGPANQALLNNPTADSFDAAGNLYITDQSNHRIRKIDTNGIITTVAGNGSIGFSGDGGPALSASLNFPGATVIDNAGNLFIVDTKNQVVRKVSGGIITTVAGTPGATGNTGDGGPPLQAKFKDPFAITVDPAGNLYIGDTNNNRVRKISGLASPPPPCTYSLSAGGQVFPAAGGSGTITVTTAQGCAWNVSGTPVWVTGANSGSGAGPLNYQVVANPGAARTTTLTVAGISFNIEQQPAIIAGLDPYVGWMAHLAAEENWTTTFTLVNKNAFVAQTRVSFFGDALDPTGNGPLLLPLVFAQQASSSPLLAASFDRVIPGNASLTLNTAGAQVPPVLVGSAQLAATGQVDGFAIFHQNVTTQEAVVPMETREADSYILAFDNSGALSLGVAVQNASAQNAVIPIVIRDDRGILIPTAKTTISLEANGHTSFVLSDAFKGFPETANKRGTIEFDTPVGGRISVLGLRFTPPNNSLTTIPALADVGAGGGSIAHLASGGDGWETTFVLVNTGTSQTQATLSFFADQTGAPLSLPLSFPQDSIGIVTEDVSVTRSLAAGATLIVQSYGSPQLLTGSAQLTTTGAVGGFVIFRHNGQEAVVALESRNASGYIVAFDNTHGTFTGVALNAVSTQQVSVPVVVRSESGAQIATDTITLAKNGHYAFTLGTDRYPGTANIRGTIEFTKPAEGQIGALGIRIPNVPAHTYTTLPALAK